MELSVSILNSKDRKKDINKLISNNKVNYIHYDVMDGIFVNDIEFNTNELEDLFKIKNKNKDIHLMVKNPKEYIKFLVDYDVSYITIHSEIDNVEKYINMIKKSGKKVGLAVNPDTLIKDIEKYLDKVDLILIMSVHPGLGGQKFIDASVDKIRELKGIIDKNNYNIKIEVDGGVNNTNSNLLRCIGVDIIVVGSFITKSDNFNKQIDILM